MKELDRKLRIAIVLDENDANGHDLVIKTFQEQEILEMFTPIVYGSLPMLKMESQKLQLKYNAYNVGNASQANPDALNFVDITGKKAIEVARKEFEAELFDAFVTLPYSKETSLYLRSTTVPNVQPNSQEEDVKPISVLCTNQLHVSYVVVEKQNVAGITSESIEAKARLLYNTLMRDLRQDNPRVAILSYNDEIVADEKSLEMQIIGPAISKLVNSGYPVFGPYQYKDFFENGHHLHFDAVLTMTREQATKPFLSMYDGNGLVLTAGIPVVEVSPVKLDGDNNATESTFREAIYLAVDAFRSRYFFNQPFANPLPKMYHERREDGEKARFAVKKRFPDGDSKGGEKPAEQKGEKKED